MLRCFNLKIQDAFAKTKEELQKTASANQNCMHIIKEQGEEIEKYEYNVTMQSHRETNLLERLAVANAEKLSAVTESTRVAKINEEISKKLSRLEHRLSQLVVQLDEEIQQADIVRSLLSESQRKASVCFNSLEQVKNTQLQYEKM